MNGENGTCEGPVLFLHPTEHQRVKVVTNGGNAPLKYPKFSRLWLLYRLLYKPHSALIFANIHRYCLGDCFGNRGLFTAHKPITPKF